MKLAWGEIRGRLYTGGWGEGGGGEFAEFEVQGSAQGGLPRSSRFLVWLLQGLKPQSETRIIAALKRCATQKPAVGQFEISN